VTGVGLCLPQLGPGITADLVRQFCERAERRGFTSLWVQEHMMVPVEPVKGHGGVAGRGIPAQYRSALAALELLSAAAAWTSSVRVGTSILVGGYHRPVELAQRLATIDHLSGGRLVVGLGVGWSEEEHEQMGVETRGRGRRLEELVAALKACWGPDPVSFEGEFFSIPRCYMNPKPLQSPHPPLIAGARGKAALDRTSRIFDGWNPARGSVADVRAIARELSSRRTAADGSLPVWYRVFVQAPFAPAADVDAVMAATREAASAGFEEIIIDANFYEGVQRPDGWLATLDLLTPAVEAAACHPLT
jgi:probable F420-dependent oxidoreductase